MLKKLFQKITTIRVLYCILIVFFLITVVNIFYHLIAGQYQTATAIAITTSNTETFKGVYIRDESVIRYNGDGILSYEVSDGGKLGIGSVIANVYANEQDIASKRKINNLKKDLELLKKITNPGTMEVAQPATLATLIEERYKKIAYCKDIGDSSMLSTENTEFLSLLSTMQYITGQTNPEIRNNFENRMDSINTEIITLERQMAKPLDTITSNASAYFVSHIDGYETLLSRKNLDSVTSDLIKKVTDDVIASDNTNEKIVGKFIDGYKWNIAGIIENNDSVFKSGNTVNLYFETSNEKITGVIDEIRATENPDENIVIISCDIISPELVQHRTENISMSVENYEGIKVPRKAIRFNNDAKGVYIKLGESVIFKKIEVIFEGDDYVISAAKTDSEYLMLYDDIIVGGIDIN